MSRNYHIFASLTAAGCLGSNIWLPLYCTRRDGVEVPVTKFLSLSHAALA